MKDFESSDFEICVNLCTTSLVKKVSWKWLLGSDIEIWQFVLRRLKRRPPCFLRDFNWRESQVCVKKFHKGFAVPGVKFVNFATARPARKPDFASEERLRLKRFFGHNFWLEPRRTFSGFIWSQWKFGLSSHFGSVGPVVLAAGRQGCQAAKLTFRRAKFEEFCYRLYV